MNVNLINLRTILGALAFTALITGCNVSGLDDNSPGGSTGGSGASSTASDESDTEAAFTSAVEALVDSSSDAADSVASLTTSQYLAQGGTLALRPHHRCEDSESADQSFSCDNADGSMTREVTFTGCDLSNSYRDVTLNGSFTNTVENGGDGLCEASTTIDFSKMVMGRDGESAIHDHETGSDSMIYSFENDNGATVTVTVDETRVTTFSEPIDEDEDGSAETVLATVERDTHIVHRVTASEESVEDDDSMALTVEDDDSDNDVADDDDDSESASTDDEDDGEEESDSEDTEGTIKHDVNVFTTAESFVSTDEEGTATTVSVSLPVHELTFDSDGKVESRTILSGNLISDHNLAQMRLVFGVGEEGLSFDDGTTCGPVSGSMNVTGYEMNDDGSIGEVIGTGAVTFADGEVESATFDGAELNLRPRPCAQ